MEPQNGLVVRVNGIASEPSQPGVGTSCSIYSLGDRAFHLLVGGGPGVPESLNQGAKELRMDKTSPDAILITHAHTDQTSSLSQLAAGQPAPKIYCTSECIEELIKEFPSLSTQFTVVVAGQPVTLGPFTVLPIGADHTGDKIGAPGAVIYVIKMGERKVICGWDFLSLHATDTSVFWNPDLLILGTETYNEHPSTGKISVSEAYNLVRRWHAKECWIVGYDGKKDAEDARNQWFRGPTKPLTPTELQDAINEHLRVSGEGGKFSIKVAKQGTTWTPSPVPTSEVDPPIGDLIEIDGIEKYALKLQKTPDGVRVTVEDSIHRLESDFAAPHLTDGNMGLVGEPVKGFMAKGPELRLTVVAGEPTSVVKLSIAKGKKPMVSDEIVVSQQDASRLLKYINHHFGSPAQTVASSG